MPAKSEVSAEQQTVKAEPRFTPGPWGVESPFGNDSLAIVANAEKPTYDWKVVASCFSDEIGEEPNGIPLIEHNANAHLISAAPELCEALDKLMAFGIAIEGTHGYAFILQARAALAKARGDRS